MMYLTRVYFSALSIFIVLNLQSCNLFDNPDSVQPCEHELFAQGHFFELPVSFIPYKQEYNLGDTIEVNMTFSDSIYDHGAQKKFKIEDMPFRPISSLYRVNVEEETWDSGFRVNELILDTTKFDFLYQNFSVVSDNIRANLFYNVEEDRYEYDYQIVFNEPGV